MANLIKCMQVALAVGADELRPTLPPDTPDRLVALAAACYEPDPEHRPSFGLITHHLRQVLAYACSNIPIKLKHLPTL